eukprot:jgi/Mesvir1/18535/Mv05049-RA.1
MAQLISETGDRKWVKHVIENAMYTDKITNVLATATPPNGTSDGKLEISFEIADYNSATGTTRKFVITDSMIPPAEKFVPMFTSVAPNQRQVWASNPPTFTTRLVGRYVFLDDYERQQFASESHEFLMTENQLHTQYVGGQEQVTIDLKFNHPVKELLFFYRPDNWAEPETTVKGYYKGYWSFRNPNSSFGEGHLFRSANLILNSQNINASSFQRRVKAATRSVRNDHMSFLSIPDRSASSFFTRVFTAFFGPIISSSESLA